MLTSWLRTCLLFNSVLACLTVCAVVMSPSRGGGVVAPHSCAWCDREQDKEQSVMAKFMAEVGFKPGDKITIKPRE